MPQGAHSTSLRRAAGAWLPVVLWFLLLALASGDVASEANVQREVSQRLPAALQGPSDTGDHGFDPVALVLIALRKPAHLLVYGVLGLLLLRALRLTWPAAGRRSLALTAVALAGLVAAMDEIRQSFEPGRTGLFKDVLIDMAGAALAIWLVWRLPRWRANRSQEREAADARRSEDARGRSTSQ